jgi:hypothetical protein
VLGCRLSGAISTLSRIKGPPSFVCGYKIAGRFTVRMARMRRCAQSIQCPFDKWHEWGILPLLILIENPRRA